MNYLWLHTRLEENRLMDFLFNCEIVDRLQRYSLKTFQPTPNNASLTENLLHSSKQEKILLKSFLLYPVSMNSL